MNAFNRNPPTPFRTGKRRMASLVFLLLFWVLAAGGRLPKAWHGRVFIIVQFTIIISTSEHWPPAIGERAVGGGKGKTRLGFTAAPSPD